MAASTDTAVRLAVAPIDETPRTKTRRIYDTADKILAATIHRSSGLQLRIYAVLMVARDAHTTPRRDDGPPPAHVNISVARWFKDHAGEWQSDRKPWRGGPLLMPSEVPLVAAALQRAVEAAREKGWRLR